MLKVPLEMAAEVTFEGFKHTRPDILGDYQSLGAWKRFFLETYTEAYNEALAWVLVASRAGSHCAEIHAYAFDRSFRDKRAFFERVVAELEAQGKRRLWTTLYPTIGRRAKVELRALGFELEGILRDFYYFGPEKGFADAELWARISVDPKGGE